MTRILKNTTLMQKQFSLPSKIILTVVIMFFLILFVYSFNIPNPNMILIAGLVLCSALFGYGGGIVGSLIMLGYSLYFFSTNHDFVTFTPQNLQKVGVSIVGITADMLLVCSLKHAEVNAFETIRTLTERLSEENKKLQHISSMDALTGIRNRLALRQDFESYAGHTAAVMMLDLNDFKGINDSHGHEEGDRILKETGELLAATFGPEHCYRYGGDEFLVIVPDLSEKEFAEKLKSMAEKKPKINSESVMYSAGYVCGMLDTPAKLRELIGAADEKMYREKRNIKRTKSTVPEIMEPEFPTEALSAEEAMNYIDSLKDKYDLIRIVDPTECRIIDLNEDGSVERKNKCYGIWNSEQRCLNCTSRTAGNTGCSQTKAEVFQNQLYYIQSSPIRLKMPDGTDYDAVVELVDIQPEGEAGGNNREAENIGNWAAGYMASHDSMTDTLTPDAFYEACRTMIKDRPDTKWVMITSNIMNFRLINTLFGELKGNEVLIRTAALLKGMAERTEGICSRLGNDQFAIFVPGNQFQEKSLHNINHILAKPFSSGAYTFRIHFGIAAVEDKNEPISVMCGKANSALRTIREDLSRVTAYYDDEIRSENLQKQKIISGLDEALRENRLRMYLQPIATADGGIVGAEALVRWITEDGTMIMPGAFIETLEQAGLIHKLDAYIWELAVKQLQSWKNTDLKNMFISVNLSPRDFYSTDVYRTLTDLLEKYDAESWKLRLELTETALITEQGDCEKVIEALRDKGFIIEIDDFGTGYSSLSLLKNIRADVLKIDRSFLQEIEGNEHHSRILAGVISLAKSLGLDIISEGVETKQQLETLSAMECRYFQGFYFSRPLPAEEFEALARTGIA